VQEAFLDGVLRILVRHHDGACDRVRPSLVRPDEGPKRVLIAALSGRHELAFLGAR
jgi:hypothetical protein